MPGDKREDSDLFRTAKEQKVDSLLEKGAFRVVNISDIPCDANIQGGRFFWALKNKRTDREKPKPLYVPQGHKDKEKPFIVHNISTIRQSSVKVIVSTSAVSNFLIFFP